MKHARKLPQQGFTLIELIVVIVIIGILAAFAIPRFSNIAKDARISSVNGLLGTIRSTSALVHGLSLARPTESPILLEGASVNLVNKYPAPTAAGIGAALSSTDGYSEAATPPADTIIYQVLGAATPLNCSVSYKMAAADAVPTITATTTGC